MLGSFHTLRRGLALLTLAGGMALGSSGMLEAHETKGHEPRRGRAETRLERAGFELVGEPRRKGDFLIVTVTRESLSWRIVVDQRSGEIVGQKLIGHAPPASD